MKKISRRNFMAAAVWTAAALTACGRSGETTPSSPTPQAEPDGKVHFVAMCCNSGTLNDESFNQQCWEAVLGYMGEEHCQYYIPALEASEEEREAAIRQAVADNADTVVCVGYQYGETLSWAAEHYPDTRFIAVDVTREDIGVDQLWENCCCITFKENQAGYLAGYAAVRDGYTKLGFLGGMADPAVIRFGYGYLQGIDAAAQEMQTPVSVNYLYAGQYYSDMNITSRMEGWYSSGTQVVFACGGAIYVSVLEAALKTNAHIIGVDVDQNHIGVSGVESGLYDYNPFLTSAMKNLSVAVRAALAAIDAGEWKEFAAADDVFGLEEGDYVGLPTAESSWNFHTFTVEEYEAIKEKIARGEIVVNDRCEDGAKPELSRFTTVNYVQ